jgi:ABC-2 type transport system permease protein
MGLYLGFEALADLYKFSGWELTVRNLGINEHYRSMSRGVIDARDLGYFVSLVLLFIGATVAVIGRPHLKSPWGKAGVYVGAAILLLLLSFSARFRFDLTEEQRFSLSEGTASLLSQIEEPLLIKVYLSGDFPAGFERLQRETQHQLEEWSAKNGNVFFEFINPNTVDNANEFKNQLGTKGINAVQLQVQNKDGQSVLNVFPGAILSYQEREATAVLLEDVMVYDPAEQVNISIQQLEFNLAKALNTLLTTDKPKVAMITGHGELSAVETGGIGLALSGNYTVDRFSMTAYKALPTGDPAFQDLILRLEKKKWGFFGKPKKGF